jgi:NHL repeat
MQIGHFPLILMRKFPRFLIFLAVAWLPIVSATAGAQTNFGSVNVGDNATSAVTLTIPSAVTLGSISVVTQGAPGLDFTNAGTGTCDAGASYTASQTCTVEVAFKPTYAGARYGATLLKDGSGDVIATGFVAGVGVGPQIAYGLKTPIVINPIVDGENLGRPSGVAVDGAGNLYIADYENDRVVMVPANGGAATAIDTAV